MSGKTVEVNPLNSGKGRGVSFGTGSEPCKPTTSSCPSPTHFVRRKKTKARDAVVPVRFTPDERDRLKQSALASKVSLSEFIRRAALKRRLPPPPAPEINLKSYQELALIGNNLNQLVRAIHKGKCRRIDVNLIRELLWLVRETGMQLVGGGGK